MTVTDSTKTQRPTVSHTPVEHTDHERETRRFAKTSEFWAMAAGVIVVAVIYMASSDQSLDLWRATLLGTVIAVAYIVSRGLAKAGSRDHTHTNSY
jgi:hypothetical protein